MSIIIVIVITIHHESPEVVGMVQHSLRAVVLQPGGGRLDEALELRPKVRVYSRIGRQTQKQLYCSTELSQVGIGKFGDPDIFGGQ
jgi:hypothetical protein